MVEIMDKKEINRFIKEQYTIWRILSACFLLVIMGRLAHSLYLHDWSMTAEAGNIIPPALVLLFSVIGTGFSIFLVCKPAYVTLLGYFSLFYSCTILIDTPFHPFGAFGYLFSAYLLCPRSFTQKKHYAKAITLAVIFIGVSFSGIRFGVQTFLLNFGITIGQIATVVGIISIHDAQRIEAITSPAAFQKTIILTKQYPFLTDRDIEWILKITAGEKYLSIAIASDCSEGYVRNYMSDLYKKMALAGGRAELLQLFSENTILVNDDE